ncbi:hypothetical protein DE146DRAFT_786260 [Phaeosphaeria sp. MPI-PUGE-AT-0046c]|nr:hypothetical protein DE146DRAFT_786260 [Phaeosphaeria sp. MPI-PUGE-AT-0046c]
MSGQSLNPLALIAAQQRAAREAATAKPISYVPPSKKGEILGYTVERIYAVCHPVSPTSGSGETNHWTMKFDVGEGKSVSLDIQPDPRRPHTNGGFKACVIVSLLGDHITVSAERYDLVSVTYGRPVSWYIDYFASAKRFRYAFAPSGIGCRQWITDTLQLLADAGEVNRQESTNAQNAIVYLWPARTPCGLVSGTYFE